MPYITREDGERFVIPSYRDTINAKKTSVLKKEVETLSANYGEYITLQRKSAAEYEIAFSPDSGYLFGECVWDNFKRPFDMIYCEEVAGTREAYLVVVKSGTVYLDGTFPIDSIAEELVIFKTQQNNFSIYVYGDVPLSETPEDGKFYFDHSSINTFTLLTEPAFPTLPASKTFQLQTVDVVLKTYGVGVLPIKQVVITIVMLGLLSMGYLLFNSSQKELPQVFNVIATNPYQGYIDALTSPEPAHEIRNALNAIQLLYTVPGWDPGSFSYESGTPAHLHATLSSTGALVQIVLDWARRYNAHVDILPTGANITLDIASAKRAEPTSIYRVQTVLANMMDSLAFVLPPNSLTFSNFPDKRPWKNGSATLNFTSVSPFILDMIGQYIKGMPLVITKFSGTLANDQITGSITFNVLGN